MTRLALLNLTRRPGRTLRTVLTVMLAVASLVIARAWLAGIFDPLEAAAEVHCGHVRLSTVGWADGDTTFPTWELVPHASALADQLVREGRALEADPRVVAPVTLGRGGTVGEVVGVLVGAPVAWCRRATKGPCPERPGQVVLGAALARDAHVRVGDRIEVVGQTQDGAPSGLRAEAIALIEADDPLLARTVIATLDDARYLGDLADGANEILLYGDDRSAAPGLASETAAFAPDLVVQPWSDRDPYAGLLVVEWVIRDALAALVVAIGALGVWNTQSMAVIERTAELAVLRALGATRRRIVAACVLEGLAIGVVGSLAGAALGAAGAWWLSTHGLDVASGIREQLTVAVPSRICASLTPRMVLDAAAAGCVLSAVGSIPATVRAALADPIVGLRSRR